MSETYKAILEKANAAIVEGDFERDEEGKETSNAYCDVWRFRDGRMASLHAFVVEARLESGVFA